MLGPPEQATHNSPASRGTRHLNMELQRELRKPALKGDGEPG